MCLVSLLLHMVVTLKVEPPHIKEALPLLEEVLHQQEQMKKAAYLSPSLLKELEMMTFGKTQNPSRMEEVEPMR